MLGNLRGMIDDIVSYTNTAVARANGHIRTYFVLSSKVLSNKVKNRNNTYKHLEKSKGIDRTISPTCRFYRQLLKVGT